jgi:hypothetical protein
MTCHLFCREPFENTIFDGTYWLKKYASSPFWDGYPVWSASNCKTQLQREWENRCLCRYERARKIKWKLDNEKLTTFGKLYLRFFCGKGGEQLIAFDDVPLPLLQVARLLSRLQDACREKQHTTNQ